MRPTCAAPDFVIHDLSDPDPTDRRRSVAAILARGVARLLAPSPRPPFSAGRSFPNLSESLSSELALTAEMPRFEREKRVSFGRVPSCCRRRRCRNPYGTVKPVAQQRDPVSGENYCQHFQPLHGSEHRQVKETR